MADRGKVREDLAIGCFISMNNKSIVSWTLRHDTMVGVIVLVHTDASERWLNIWAWPRRDDWCKLLAHHKVFDVGLIHMQRSQRPYWHGFGLQHWIRHDFGLRQWNKGLFGWVTEALYSHMLEKGILKEVWLGLGKKKRQIRLSLWLHATWKDTFGWRGMISWVVMAVA